MGTSRAPVCAHVTAGAAAETEGQEDTLPAQTPAPHGLLFLLCPGRPAGNEGGPGGAPPEAGRSGLGWEWRLSV